MKTTVNKNKHLGFSFPEMLLVTIVVGVLVVLISMKMNLPQHGGHRPQCLSNQKQLILAFKIYAGDHDQKFPMTDLATLKTIGQQRGNTNQSVWEYFTLATNEISSAKLLVCPGDVVRRANSASDFSDATGGLAHGSKQDGAISYFLGMSADETKPNMIAVGDRNLSADSATALYSSAGGKILEVFTNSVWRTFPNQPFHGDSGYYALADGSAQQGDNNRLREALRQARDAYGTNANRLLFPQ